MAGVILIVPSTLPPPSNDCPQRVLEVINLFAVAELPLQALEVLEVLALPEILIPQVPVAPVPVNVGA